MCSRGDSPSCTGDRSHNLGESQKVRVSCEGNVRPANEELC